MDEAQVKAFLAALGCKHTKTSKKWVSASCPLAPWTHSKGTDVSMGFGVSISPGQLSGFNCMACGNHGPLLELQHLAEHHTAGIGSIFGMDFKLSRAVLAAEETGIVPLPPYQPHGASAYKPFEEWPTWYLDTFPSAVEVPVAMTYLFNRGVTHKMADTFRLLYDPSKKMIVAPFWNVHGKLAGCRGRSINPNAAQPHHDYTWNDINNTGNTWYNEMVLQADKPVIIVEGQFDCIHVLQAYPYVMAGLSAYVTEQKLKMLQFAPAILFMLDNDLAGTKQTEEYTNYLIEHGVKVGVIEYPMEWKDPDKIPLEWLKENLVFD